MTQYEKCFFEETTGTYHKSLKSAKSLGRFKDGSYPYVYRCWMKDGVIVAKYPVSAYGGSCCSIKYADECIAEKLNRS